MKRLLLFLLLFAGLANAQQVTPTKSPTVGEDNSFSGTEVWSSPGNITSSNDAYASVTVTENLSNDVSHWLVGRGYGLGVPTNVSIAGIQATVEGKKTAGTAGAIIRVTLMVNGAPVGTAKIDGGGSYSTSDTIVTYGGANDLWGASLTPDNTNGAGFGIAVQVESVGGLGTSYSFAVDHITVKVYYTSPILSPELGFYHDRAVGVSPFGHIVGLIPIAYGQVRVCTELATNSPCSPIANIFDDFGNALSVQSGNFGQLTTDVTGQFHFGCTTGNYLIQVAASSSNTPMLNYKVTCTAGGTTGTGEGTIILNFQENLVVDNSTFNNFYLTLLGDVITTTIVNNPSGGFLYFTICQDASGGHTFNWPTNFFRPPIVAGGPLECTDASFKFDDAIFKWRNVAATGDALMPHIGGGPSGSVDARWNHYANFVDVRDYVLWTPQFFANTTKNRLQADQENTSLQTNNWNGTTHDDLTKPSWSVTYGAKDDEFCVSRSAPSSTVFIDLFCIDQTGVVIGGGGIPGPPDTSVQYNNAGAFGGADIQWDSTSKILRGIAGGPGLTWTIVGGQGNSGTAGGSLTVGGGDTSGAAAAGSLLLKGGGNASGSSTGGSVTLRPGVGTTLGKLLFEDPTDNTKKARMIMSSITTATTRDFTWPDQSGTICLTTTCTGATINHVRVTTGSCGTTGCQVTGTWSTAFASTSYTANCSVEDSTSQSEVTGLRVAKISSRSTTQVVVDIDNFSGSGITGTLHCVGVLD